MVQETPGMGLSAQLFDQGLTDFGRKWSQAQSMHISW
jgi:hypothetical protein